VILKIKKPKAVIETEGSFSLNVTCPSHILDTLFCNNRANRLLEKEKRFLGAFRGLL